MRQVIIERKKTFFGGGVFQVCFDGKVIGTIRNGKSISFAIDEESHLIQCIETSPVTVYGDKNGISGGGGTTVSDIVNIPSGSKSAFLFVEPGWGSLKLKLVKLY